MVGRQTLRFQLSAQEIDAGSEAPLSLSILNQGPDTIANLCMRLAGGARGGLSVLGSSARQAGLLVKAGAEIVVPVRVRAEAGQHQLHVSGISYRLGGTNVRALDQLLSVTVRARPATQFQSSVANHTNPACQKYQPVAAFISYAHKDENLLNELLSHLKLLRMYGDLDLWYDRDTTPGEKWAEKINENLLRASVVFLLLSPDFIDSDYCHQEMNIALSLEAAGQARVVPIVARPCAWRRLPVRAYQALPRDGKPVADAGHSQSHRDVAWVEVETGIRRMLKEVPRRPI